ncbi:MAG: LCP family protein [Ardenticatenales bacterium]|nr:LCP family protein [Ardenticatenales bacterium]
MQGWWRVLCALFYQFARGPLELLWATAMGGMALALTLILAGSLLYEPTLVRTVRAPAVSSPLVPPDFTPLATAPSAFRPYPSAVPPLATMRPTGPMRLYAPISSAAVPLLSPIPTSPVMELQAERSKLAAHSFVSILLLGTDARPEEGVASRTDTMMVLFLDLESSSATLISIPRDLWVAIPGYGEGRINTAYFMGQAWYRGAEVARQTVSQVLGIPIGYTVVIDFDGFRQIIDSMGGVEVDVPEAIDDPAYPDDSYGSYRLYIPAGPQQMDGAQMLRYVRTRYGSNDLERAARQQAVLEAIRQHLLSPQQLPSLPGYLTEGSSQVDSTLSLADLFFLAHFAQTLKPQRIQSHVLAPPLLWNGVTADGQQVLLYDSYSLQQNVQRWLYESNKER